MGISADNRVKRIGRRLALTTMGGLLAIGVACGGGSDTAPAPVQGGPVASVGAIPILPPTPVVFASPAPRLVATRVVWRSAPPFVAAFPTPFATATRIPFRSRVSTTTFGNLSLSPPIGFSTPIPTPRRGRYLTPTPITIFTPFATPTLFALPTATRTRFPTPYPTPYPMPYPTPVPTRIPSP